MKRIPFRLLAVSSLLIATAMAGTRPRYGGNLRIEIAGTGWEDDGIARKLVGETLTTIDDKGDVQPALALRWEPQNGSRRWQFWLRPGVKFHDGSLLTPAVVAQTLSASSCKDCPWRSARAAGDTVVFDSDAPMPLLPAQLALSRFVVTKVGDNAAVIGTGPFRVDQIVGDKTSLHSFDDYWQAAPFLDSIEIVGGRKQRDQLLDWTVGRVDVIEIPTEELRRAQQDRWRVTPTRDVELIAVVIDSNNAALQDLRIRQAISESVDRNSLLNAIFQHQGEISSTLLPNWLTGYGPLFPASRDLDQARELRGQWIAPIPPLTIGYDPADTTEQLIAERLALNIREIGLTVQAVARTQNTDMHVASVALPSMQPSVALEGIAATLKLGTATPDDATPESVYKRERALLGDYKAIPLLHVPKGYAISNRVHNWTLSTSGDPILSDVWVGPRL